MNKHLRRNGVEILNVSGTAPVLLLCDHAGNLIPPQYEDLGVPRKELKRHIAWDPGAADVTRYLSKTMNAPAVFQHVSRLVIDVNRPLDHGTSIPPVSDKTDVPGNKALKDADIADRQRRYFWDYHVNVEAVLAQVRARGTQPAVLCIHSFTDMLEIHGEKRPWHLGVLHGKDRTFSDLLYDELSTAYPELKIGDDEPYSGTQSGAYTHYAHAENIGLPFVVLEIRQDLIATQGDAEHWAEKLRGPVERALVRYETRSGGAGDGAGTPSSHDGPTLASTLRPGRLGRPTRFTMGVEEEYHIVHPESGSIIADPPRAFFDEVTSLDGRQITPEFYRFQVEIGTKVCEDLDDLQTDLVDLRRIVRETAAKHELAIAAAGTHPTVRIDDQLVTDKDRYTFLREDLAYPARRLLTCGMHVHAGIPDPELRIDLFGQIRYFLPYFLALSTSSPFWHSRDTGLMSYRLPVFHELKNTGLPPVFPSARAFDDFVDYAVDLGITEDKTMLWWDVRPNQRHPTLELRIMDVCTRVDDAMAITALYLCTLSMLTRLRQQSQSWRVYEDGVIQANIWEAMKNGTECSFVDLTQHRRVPFRDVYENLVEMLQPDIDHYGCAAAIDHGRKIIERGTSARQQIRIYEETLAKTQDKEAAFREVVAWLVAETAKP